MGKLISEKYAAPQHKSNLRNIRGTFAAEGMTISKSTRSNLDRIASGQTSYQQVLTELRAKYEEPPQSPSVTAPMKAGMGITQDVKRLNIPAKIRRY